MTLPLTPYISLFTYSAVLQLVDILLSLCRGDRAVADGRGDLFQDVGPAVASGEDPRRRGVGVLAGADVAAGIEIDQAFQESGDRGDADGDEHADDRKVLFGIGFHVAYGDAGQAAVVGLQSFDNTVPDHFDLVVGKDTLLQDLGRPQLVATMDQVDLAGKTGEEQRLFGRGVAAADDGDGYIAEEGTVAGGTVGDAAADQRRFTVDAKLARVGAGGDDDCLAGKGLAVDGQAFLGAEVFDFFDFAGAGLQAELDAMLLKAAHQLGAVDTARITGPVLDFGRGHHLPAHDHLFDQKGF